MMNVEDFMTSEVFSVPLDMRIREAIELLTSKRISGAPVLDKLGCVVSVVSEGDLLKLAAAGKLNESIVTCLANLTSVNKLVSIKRNSTFVEAYRLFLANSVHRLVVTDSAGKLQGIVSRSNVLRILIEASPVDSSAGEQQLKRNA